MKVLFAVNNDKISEAVIKKYPKEYKELLSYKNVYYFNAILKEIQNDKSYDRIVISEDLEPFVNTNHDSIDNFIFNHLDKISDEAQGNDGREMSIILICSERRTFGSGILNKLFSIGIYNALIGNDRSMDNLCKLINRPRNKKEAKIYYKIDQATYESAVDNGEVSETEIQNILNHFKKLGKSTDRYTDSFNNIAAQYTDDQLKLIVNVLPMKVKAVLEAESDKYQSLMGTSGENRVRASLPNEPGISVNTIGSGRTESNVNGPIVIPSGVKRFTNGSRPIIPNNTASREQVRPQTPVSNQVQQARPTVQPNTMQQARPVAQTNPVQQARPVQQQVNPASQVQRRTMPQVQATAQVQQRPAVQPNAMQQARPAVQPNTVQQARSAVQQNPVQQARSVAQANTVQQARPVQQQVSQAGVQRQNIIPQPVAKVQAPVVEEEPVVEDLDEMFDMEEPNIEEAEDFVNNDIEIEEEPTVEPVVETVQENKPQSEGHTGQRYTGTIAQVKRTLIARRKSASVTPVAPVQPEIIPEVPELEVTDDVEEVEVVEQKRGRGRPRKPVTEQEVKPKGKRGRPRKVPLEEENNLDDLLGGIGVSPDDEVMMPGLEESTLPGLDETENDETLPGLEDSLDDEVTIPGLEEETEEVAMPGLNDDFEDDNVMPGLEENLEDVATIPGLDDVEDDGLLPGLDDDSAEGEEVDVSSLLAGLDDDDDSGALPGLDDTTEDESLLPGLDDAIEDDGLLPGLDDATDDDSLLPGLDDATDDDSLLPGLDDTVGDDSLIPGLDDTVGDDSLIPGLDGTVEDDGLLPGFDDASGDDDLLPGLDNGVEDDGLLPGFDNSAEDDTMIPGLDDDFSGASVQGNSFANNESNENNAIESIKPQIDYSMSNLNSLLSKDKKIVAFLGATKNGTSFLINNLALMFSMMGINTAILDMTQNKNSYYLFTDSREELRKIAYTSLSKLENGYADGIKFNKNLTVYTALPSDGAVFENAEPILSTLVQNHSLVLIDTDFTTPPAYFASSQEIYLVQSMDILTIQPLTAFLRELKFKGAWEPEKARVVINKEVQNRILTKKTIVGGMSRYNGPDMSVMTDLFNKDMVNVCSIPFDEKVYASYLETLATCKLSISSLPKQFRSKLELLANMVYPRLNSKTSYSPSPEMGGVSYNQSGNTFSNNTNSILNKMKKKF